MPIFRAQKYKRIVPEFIRNDDSHEASRLAGLVAFSILKTGLMKVNRLLVIFMDINFV